MHLVAGSFECNCIKYDKYKIYANETFNQQPGMTVSRHDVSEFGTTSRETGLLANKK